MAHTVYMAPRGTAQIIDDMDSAPPECSLTAQWGHCSQELINLLLTGVASSNVFDGVMDLGGLLMKGVVSKPQVGYLTQLEALRYCQVGTFYKTPTHPIWVVGSQSHFSVMFGTDMRSITESNSDLLLTRVRRSWRTVDGEGGGFITITSLREVLAGLLMDPNDNGTATLLDKVKEENVLRFATHLEEDDSGIIIWDKFWKSVSRLMTGAGLESVLEDGSSSALIVVGNGGNGQDAAAALEKNAAAAPQAPLEMEVGGAGSPYNLRATHLRVRVNHPIKTRRSKPAFKTSLSKHAYQNTLPSCSHRLKSSGPSVYAIGVCVWSHSRSLRSQVHSDSFDLLYYNGLREGNMIKFNVTKLTAEDAVGASVALSSGGGGGGGHAGNALEEVCRTRFVSARFDWHGQNVPSID